MMAQNRIDRLRLLRELRARFAIDWHGYHGVAHWARVRVNGLLLAKQNGAYLHIVELFSFFHDSCRKSEGDDSGHGARGADLAKSFRDDFFDVTDDDMALLELACSAHSDGRLLADITVQTCWDADRLDLSRVGISPEAQYLCTPQARNQEFISAASARASAWKKRFMVKST